MSDFSSAPLLKVSDLSKREFELFRGLVYEKSGLCFPDDKQQVVSTRLSKRMRELKIESFADYYRHVTEDRTGVPLMELIDALTTNHTSFFREQAHFDFLRQTILPGLRSRGRLDFWSAACSTGEEPFSVALLLLDEGIPQSRIHVLATDISTRVLEIARKAIYPVERLQGLSEAQCKRYLVRGKGEWTEWFLLRKEVRSTVEYRHLNLMETFHGIDLFPVILCRNLLIYFDRTAQQHLVNRLSDHLEPGGYLFTGHSETLNGLDHSLEYVQAAVYRKPLSGAGRGRK
jgi:chemotaxis protein methyltransferase CheR